MQGLYRCIVIDSEHTRMFLSSHYENLPMQYTEIFKVVKNKLHQNFFDIWGGSNEYPQSMFWSKNKKNR